MSTSERQQPSHLPALDGLRGLAILLVVPHNASRVGAEGFARIFTLGAGAGWIGVELFFVLSGFLITLNLLDTVGSANYYRVFYARRTLRIFPLYYSTLALVLVVLPAIGLPLVQDATHQAWLWVYLSNWADPFDRTVLGLGHFWSLAVEEQFYLAWPFLVAVFAKRLVRFCLILALVALVSRVLILTIWASPNMAYHFTFCRMDALVLGALAAALYRSRTFALPRGWSASRLFWAGIALVVIGAPFTNFYYNGGFGSMSWGLTLLSVAFAMIVMAAALPGQGWWRKLLEAGVLRSVGKYSYAMYVVHWPIQLAWEVPLRDALAWTGILQPVAYMILLTVLSYAGAFVSYHLLEKHFLRLKKYFVPAPRALAGRTADPAPKATPS